MSTSVLDPPTIPASAAPAQQLRLTNAAVRVSFTWLGVRKSLTPQQKALAAESFGAEGTFLSAGKKLLDTRHPAYRAVTAVRGKVQALWKERTTPFPEPGIRLIRRQEIPAFDAQMRDLRTSLAAAVAQLDERYGELKTIAHQRLGSLYNPADYPETLVGLFGVEWDYPPTEPPEYLLELAPAIFEQECARVASRFEEAVRLTEQAFLEEFSGLVSHLCERLTGDTGERKVFRDSAVGNLAEFFERFRQLNVGSSEELDRLVEQAQRVVRGVDAQDLRDSNVLRGQVALQLSAVQASLDGMMVNRPRRRVLRGVLPPAAAEERP